MATTTMTFNSQDITVSGTTEHDIDFDAILPTPLGVALIKWLSGTAVQFSSNGVAISSGAITLSSGNPNLILPLKEGVKLKYKGGAGSETFSITVLRPGL